MNCEFCDERKAIATICYGGHEDGESTDAVRICGCCFADLLEKPIVDIYGFEWGIVVSQDKQGNKKVSVQLRDFSGQDHQV